jgi:hypothetical protein
LFVQAQNKTTHFIAGVYEHIRNDGSSSLPGSSTAPAATFATVAMIRYGNVTAFVGQTAHLHCAVRDIGERTVSAEEGGT